MIGATGTVASYTPVAGDSFVLYGGDTWVASDLGINTCPSGCWNGTSGAPISITVDKTWFTGASWARPIFNCQNTTCTLTGGSVMWLYSDYWILDNVEFTGYRQTTGGGNIITTIGAGVEVKNTYIHGFSRDSGSSGNNSFAFSTNFSSGSGGAGSSFHDNVIDGSDSPNQDFMGGVLHGPAVYNNVIRYVYNGMNGVFNDIHANLVEYNYVATSGDHCNMIFPQDLFSGTTIKIYNNVIRHAGCSGGTVLFTLANSSNTSAIAYQYNNVLYDNATASSEGIGSGGHNPTGVYYDYNNTVQASGSNCFGNGEAPNTKSVTNWENNHCISGLAPCIGTGTTCNDLGGNITQTLAAANSAGYNASQTYAYSPISSGSPTVGTGNNLTGSCSGALADLCADTTYPEYDSVNHVVVFRSANSRPSSGAWGSGAYQFVGGVFTGMGIAGPAISAGPSTKH